MLLAAVAMARTCGSANKNVTKEEAIENAAFEPCPEQRCRQVRFVQRGIPVRGYWAVVLSERLDELGQPNRIQTFLVSVQTGAVTRP